MTSLNNKLRIVSILTIITLFITFATATVWAVEDNIYDDPITSSDVIDPPVDSTPDYTNPPAPQESIAPSYVEDDSQFNDNNNIDNTPSTHSANSSEYVFYQSGEIDDSGVYNVEDDSSSSVSSTASLYDVSKTIDSSTLDSDAWQLALDFDETAADGTGDFNFIKNNTSADDSTMSKWIFYVGCGLLAVALFGIIFVIASVSSRSKKIKAMAANNARRVRIQQGYNHQRYNNAVNKSYVDIEHPTNYKKNSYKGDTHEIDLPRDIK